MSGPKDLLFEIGTEELPSSFVAGALTALPSIVKKRFAELRLAHGDVRALGTARRLAILVAGVAERQPDLVEELTGPPAAAALDKDGKPARAAQAFAAKLGCDVSALRTVETPKGKYLAGTRRQAGKLATELLGTALGDIAGQIPFRKSMRWGAGETAFGRPVQWLVAMYGADTIDVTFAGVRSGRDSRGHRFLALHPVAIPGAAAYVERLRSAHVLVDPVDRETRMVERLVAAARETGGVLIEDAFLVGENLSLVEEPQVVAGGFDPRFLVLPEPVILEVARGHQRYFGVRGSDGRLLPRYLAVVNTRESEQNVRRGNDRAMRARLADAMFFYQEDRKTSLESRRQKLAGIVFQNRLGHMLAKSDRVEQLTDQLCTLLNLPAATHVEARLGAHLAKCDLVTLMVGEFPELQGIMGREYALTEGMDPAAADVIRDHYAPKGAADATARTDAAAVVALADKLDTLVGCFGIGLAPTGAADPLALRRSALGFLRTVLDRGYELSLTAAADRAYEGLSGISLDLDRSATVARLADFFRERLRGLLEAELPGDVVDACLSAGSDRPFDVKTRALALTNVEPAVRARAGEVFKRATNIAKGAPRAIHAPSDAIENPDPSEVALFSAFRELSARLEAATASRAWTGAFGAVAAFAPVLHRFFENVFVMVDDTRVRDNRLRLMRAISERCSKLAHFQLLAAEARKPGE